MPQSEITQPKKCPPLYLHTAAVYVALRNFLIMKLKEKYHYLVIRGVTPFQTGFQAPGGQKCQASIGLL